MSTRKSKAYVDITARVLDMTMGQLIGGFTAAGESAGKAEVIPIKGPGRSGGTTELLSGDFAGAQQRAAVAHLTLSCLRPTLDFPPVQTIRREG